MQTSHGLNDIARLRVTRAASCLCLRCMEAKGK